MWAVVFPLLLLVLSLRYNFTGRKLHQTFNKKLKTVTELNLSSSTTAPKAIVLENFTFVDSRFKSH